MRDGEPIASDEGLDELTPEAEHHHSYVGPIVRRPESVSPPPIADIEVAVRTDKWLAAMAELRHEVGNAITPIQGQVYSLRRQIKDLFEKYDVPEDIRTEMMDRIDIIGTAYDEAHDVLRAPRSAQEGMAENASAIVGEMPRLNEINVSEVLRAKVKYWRRVLRKGITIEAFGIEEHAAVMADVVKLTEVLSNAFLNAVESMRSVRGRESVLRVEVTKMERVVRIIIRDNGHGIHAKDADKIFQRGFTTKSGPGHGIGLSLSQRLMREMDGKMALINNADRPELQGDDGEALGASVILEFPAIERDPKL